MEQQSSRRGELAVGSHAITAVYGGDSNFTTSTSAILTQVVQGSGGSGPDALVRSAINVALAALDDNASFNNLVFDLASEKASLDEPPQTTMIGDRAWLPSSGIFARSVPSVPSPESLESLGSDIGPPLSGHHAHRAETRVGL